MWKARLGDHHSGGAPPRLADKYKGHAAYVSDEIYKGEGFTQTPLYQEVVRDRLRACDLSWRR